MFMQKEKEREREREREREKEREQDKEIIHRTHLGKDTKARKHPLANRRLGSSD